jgi:hypothetical protein
MVKIHARRTLSALRNTLADMNYAQRRLQEIRLGLPLEEPRRSRLGREQVDQLEALYRL